MIIQDVATCRSARRPTPPDHLLPSHAMGYPQNFAVPANFNPLNARGALHPARQPAPATCRAGTSPSSANCAKNLVLDVAYVGNRGVNLMILGDFNQARPNSRRTRTSRCRRAGRSWASPISRSPTAAASRNYHALQVKLEKRYSARPLLPELVHLVARASTTLAATWKRNNGDNSRVNYPRSAQRKGRVAATTSRSTTPPPSCTRLPFGKGRKFGARAEPSHDGVLGGWQLT